MISQELTNGWRLEISQNKKLRLPIKGTVLSSFGKTVGMYLCRSVVPECPFYLINSLATFSFSSFADLMLITTIILIVYIMSIYSFPGLFCSAPSFERIIQIVNFFSSSLDSGKGNLV